LISQKNYKISNLEKTAQKVSSTRFIDIVDDKEIAAYPVFVN